MKTSIILSAVLLTFGSNFAHSESTVTSNSTSTVHVIHACPMIAKICSDGSVAKYTGKGCETACPSDKPIVACALRVCSDGSPAKPVEGKVCEQRCPEDKNILACPQIARICKDGSMAKYLNPRRSCATTCREDYSPKVKWMNKQESKMNKNSREAR